MKEELTISFKEKTIDVRAIEKDQIQTVATTMSALFAVTNSWYRRWSDSPRYLSTAMTAIELKDTPERKRAKNPTVLLMSHSRLLS